MKRISLVLSLFSLGMAGVVLLVAGARLPAQGRVSDAVQRSSSSQRPIDPKISPDPIVDSTELVKQTSAKTNQPRPGDVELRASHVFVYVGKTGLGHEHAVIGNLKSGELHLGSDQKAGKLEFDMRSFVADTADARRYINLKGETDQGTAQKVTNNMLGPQVLNVGQFPLASFEIASIKKQRDLKDGAAEYIFEGDFTLHGVARRIRFVAMSEPVKGWNHVRGRFAIRQTDFGITPFTTALGAIGVSDELTIFGDLWVRPDQPLADKNQ